jgi:hypothetical protein
MGPSTTTTTIASPTSPGIISVKDVSNIHHHPKDPTYLYTHIHIQTQNAGMVQDHPKFPLDFVF